MENKKTRHFGGKTENFENKEEQRKEQKHLKAYLKGHNIYTFGKDLQRNPKKYPVIEIWK